MLPYGPSIERVLDIFLLCGQAIERRIEVILVKGLEPERLGHSVLGGPADRGETGPLGSDAGQDEKQDEFGPALRAEYLEQSDALRKLLERKQDGEDGTTDGLRLPREAIKLALEGPAQGLDALWRPGGRDWRGSACTPGPRRGRIRAREWPEASCDSERR